MELYQLKTFVKIADEGSLTRAAELLFTSQPAISAQIKALEEELGVNLFDRGSRGMQLTAKGRLLYDQAVATLEAANRLKADAQELQQELVGELKVGVHTDFEFMRMGELHRLLHQRHPRISPHFLSSMTANILPDIRRGVLDAGFFFGECRQTELAITRLARVPMRVVGPSAWKDQIIGGSTESLLALPWVYTSTNCPFYALSTELFSRLGAEPGTVAWVDSEDAVREFVRSGTGVSLLRADDAARFEAEGVACCWPGESLVIDLNFAVLRQRIGEPAIKAMQSVVAELWLEPETKSGSAEA